ncbi:MAG: YdjY domain-containing protein [Gemmataceae bacterium]|nr:YdjY domain-containing protein [Gemmataceae bacterium]
MTKWLSPFRFALLGILAATLLAEAADKEEIVVNKEKRTVTIPCKIAARKIDDPAYKEIYPIEVIATWPWRKDPPGGQKAHETVITFDFSFKPSQVHKALEELGLKPGKPALGEGDGKEMPVAEGPECGIFLEFTADGVDKKLPIEKTLVSRDNPKLKLPPMKWRFTGSVMKQPNPDKPEKVYGADLSGTLISVFPVTDTTVFQTQLTMKEEKLIKMETNKTLLPKEGTPCKLVIEAPAK